MDDLCSADGARKLASDIEQFWRRRGFDGIRTWVEPVNLSYTVREAKCDARTRDDGGHVFAVRSNLGGDGRPPRYLEIAA